MSEPEPTLEEITAAGPYAVIPDPYGLYTRLRNETPVVQMPGATEGGPITVMVTRYDDVRETLKDNGTFVNALLQITMGLVLGPRIICWAVYFSVSCRMPTCSIVCGVTGAWYRLCSLKPCAGKLRLRP